MVVHVSSLFRLYQFPLSRCLFALRAVGHAAQAQGLAPVAELATRSATEVQANLDMELRYRSGRNAQYPVEATTLDNLVDHGVAGIASYVDLQARMYQGTPRADAAERMRQALLPEGIAAITMLPYAAQHEQVNLLLERAAAPELQEHVAALPELTSLLARLRELNEAYGAALRQVESAPNSEQMRAARLRGQDLLAEVMALIIGNHATQPGADPSARDRLLEPILRQNAAIGAARRRRRAPVDIDPDTGNELPDEGEDEEDGDEAAEPAA